MNFFFPSKGEMCHCMHFGKSAEMKYISKSRRAIAIYTFWQNFSIVDSLSGMGAVGSNATLLFSLFRCAILVCANICI
jgi:hypothetical protein